MKLTESDKAYLSLLGYLKEDFQQIEEAAAGTVYEYEGRRISGKKAIELLGREAYLSGIGRSSFHWTAAREVQIGGVVFFNARNYFDSEV